MATTPKPTKALRNLMNASGLTLSRARTRDNAANLAPAFMTAVQDAYGGTRLGRQELDGEIMTDHPGALWTRAMIERACTDHSYSRQDDFEEVVVAIDPPASSGPTANACGIIVAGLARPLAGPPRAVVLHDGTLQGRSPEGWALAAARLYDFYNASRIVAEANQGGDMVKAVLREAGPHMALRLVHAARSKPARAAPVALLYEQNRVHHAGRLLRRSRPLPRPRRRAGLGGHRIAAAKAGSSENTGFVINYGA
jgi:phage terminase large subunit-like protein